MEATAEVTKELAEETDVLVKKFKSLEDEKLSLEDQVCVGRVVFKILKVRLTGVKYYKLHILQLQYYSMGLWRLF